MFLRATIRRLPQVLRPSQRLLPTPGRLFSDAPHGKDKPFPIDPLVVDVLESSQLETTEPVKRRRGPKKRVVVLEGPSAALPSVDEWKKYIPVTHATKFRVSLRKPETADMVAEAFVPNGSRDKVIVEAFPGPGQLTRSLLQLPKERIRKIIVLEDQEIYLNYLQPLEEQDPRVKVLPLDGYRWESYETLEKLGVLNEVQKLAWTDGVHPHLQFISHLPSNVMGEQLIAQLFRSIPDRQWLFQYGRVPLSFVLTEHLWKRVSASSESKTRCKLSVIAEATANYSEAVPYESLQPYEDHFHPARPSLSTPVEKKANKRPGNPFQAINIIPLENQVISRGRLDQWDYCLRRLFVKKATPLKSAMSSLAPGAQVLIKKISDPALPIDERVDVKTLVRQLSINDWQIILKAFGEWPFAPEDLSIDTSYGMKEV
ncbi:hypothetical protein AX16_002091 [Volvariella volvacea WC 439]|nr:hypothetical protein AX16_002091 [Volvariella volvacea WC 439]